jgi:hypothetical protein
MASPRSLAAFRQIRPEIAELFTTAQNQLESIPANCRMSSQENHLRYLVVALVGALQLYLTEILEERADELCDSWNGLDSVQRRYVSVQVRRRLALLIDAIPESDLADSKKIDRLQASVIECESWYRTPSLLARSAYREKLEGFLSDNGTKAIDRAVSQFGSSGLSFFNWLYKTCPRYRGVDDLLDSAIALRNNVAHGTFNRRVTLRDARVYRVAIYRLIGRIEAYQSAV